MSEAVTVSERKGGGVYANDIKTSRHHFYADEPLELGSSDIGPTPFEYLAAALGSCTTITLRMYGNRKKWPIEHISVNVSYSKQDGVQHFLRALNVTGDLTPEQRSRLVEIANKCPVHKVLVAGSQVDTQLA